MGRGVRAVLVDFDAHGVGRGGVCMVCGVCGVCEGRKGCVLEVEGKYLLAAVLVVLNPNLTVDLQLALALVRMLERIR